jgi:medium-chain acyl-[acyl-carrier-protein] hydrolase
MYHTPSSTRDGDRWIVRVTRRPAAPLRLICFPHAGGGASAFLAWAGAWPHDVDVLAVQPPGREGRRAEAPLTHIDPLVDAVVHALRSSLDGPFVFFGHSLGGLVAFETARALRRLGRRGPVHLVVSARRAPQMPLRKPSVFNLPDRELIDELRRLSGTSEEVLQNRELLNLYLPLLRADLEVDDGYPYRDHQKLACPISAFGGIEDPSADETQLQGWAEQTTQAFRLHRFAGGHFYLNTARASVLRVLSGILARALHEAGATDASGLMQARAAGEWPPTLP